jgi:enoyl-CoA hydratase
MMKILSVPVARSLSSSHQSFLSSRLIKNLSIFPSPQVRALSTSNKGENHLVQWDVRPLPDCPSRFVGTITLNSPLTYNALTVEMGVEFSALCREITQNLTNVEHQEVVAIVLQGGGDKAFSAGGNFDWLHSLRHKSVHANTDAMLQFYRAFLCVRQLPVPVIAALQGPAVGAGAGLALACDLRTAVSNKRIILGLNFTRLGIHAGMGVSHSLLQAGVPSAVLNELLLTGKSLSGEECLELGLVNRLATNATKAAWELASEIGKGHPVAVRTMLQTLRQRQDQGLEQALQREAYAQAVCYAREDWGRGVHAVAEKRDPVFDPYHSQ